MGRMVSVCDDSSLNEKIDKVLFSEIDSTTVASIIEIDEENNRLCFIDSYDGFEASINIKDIDNLIKALQLIKKEYNL